MIRQVLANGPFHGEGYRKVWARLRLAGIRTSKRRVLRLMGALTATTAPTSVTKLADDEMSVDGWDKAGR